MHRNFSKQEKRSVLLSNKKTEPGSVFSTSPMFLTARVDYYNQQYSPAPILISYCILLEPGTTRCRLVAVLFFIDSAVLQCSLPHRHTCSMPVLQLSDPAVFQYGFCPARPFMNNVSDHSQRLKSPYSGYCECLHGSRASRSPFSLSLLHLSLSFLHSSLFTIST
mgnify:CR=1 FL=1